MLTVYYLIYKKRFFSCIWHWDDLDSVRLVWETLISEMKTELNSFYCLFPSPMTVFVLCLCVTSHSACSLHRNSILNFFFNFSLIIWIVLGFNTKTQHWTSILPSRVPESFLSSYLRCILTCICSAELPLGGVFLPFRRATALRKSPVRLFPLFL